MTEPEEPLPRWLVPGSAMLILLALGVAVGFIAYDRLRRAAASQAPPESDSPENNPPKNQQAARETGKPPSATSRPEEKPKAIEKPAVVKPTVKGLETGVFVRLRMSNRPGAQVACGVDYETMTDVVRYARAGNADAVERLYLGGKLLMVEDNTLGRVMDRVLDMQGNEALAYQVRLKEGLHRDKDVWILDGTAYRVSNPDE
jgi:hypothetical protein